MSEDANWFAVESVAKEAAALKYPIPAGASESERRLAEAWQEWSAATLLTRLNGYVDDRAAPVLVGNVPAWQSPLPPAVARSMWGVNESGRRVLLDLFRSDNTLVRPTFDISPRPALVPPLLTMLPGDTEVVVRQRWLSSESASRARDVVDAIATTVARQAEGWLQIDEAAALLHEAGRGDARDWRAKLFAAAASGAVPMYEPGTKARVVYGAETAIGTVRRVRDFYELAHIDALNRWLAENEPHLGFQFDRADEDEGRSGDPAFQGGFAELVNNDRFIEWEYWIGQMPALSAADACRLLAGLDPDLYADIKARPVPQNNVEDACRKAAKLERLASAEGKDRDTAAAWLAWAQERRFDVHASFVLAVAESAQVAAPSQPSINDDGPLKLMGPLTDGLWLLAEAAYSLAQQQGMSTPGRHDLARRMGSCARLSPTHPHYLRTRHVENCLPVPDGEANGLALGVYPADVNAWLQACGVTYRWAVDPAPGGISSHEAAANERVADQRRRGRYAMVSVAAELSALNGWTDGQEQSVRRRLSTAVEQRELAAYDPDALEAEYPAGAPLDDAQRRRALVSVAGLNAWLDVVGIVAPRRLPGVVDIEDSDAEEDPWPTTIAGHRVWSVKAAFAELARQQGWHESEGIAMAAEASKHGTSLVVRDIRGLKRQGDQLSGLFDHLFTVDVNEWLERRGAPYRLADPRVPAMENVQASHATHPATSYANGLAPRNDAASGYKEAPTQRQDRRFKRFKELKGAWRPAGSTWHFIRNGALATLVREEARAGRPMADKSDVRKDLHAALDRLAKGCG